MCVCVDIPEQVVGGKTLHLPADAMAVAPGDGSRLYLMNLSRLLPPEDATICSHLQLNGRPLL